jgi:hypothetical protein
MRTHKSLIYFAAVLGLALLSGCASPQACLIAPPPEALMIPPPPPGATQDKLELILQQGQTSESP